MCALPFQSLEKKIYIENGAMELFYHQNDISVEQRLID